MGHTDSATLTIDMAPQIVSTNQNDVLIGSAYGDTLIYHLLNGADATGGNGADRWQNFSTAQGDKIDIHELLTGWITRRRRWVTLFRFIPAVPIR